MLLAKQMRGPYICYALEREFSTAHVIRIKTQISDDIKDSSSDIAFDLRETRYLDQSGALFLKNLDDLLAKTGRQLVLFGVLPEIQTLLTKHHEFRTFASLLDFERGFHEINPGLNQSILKLAAGKGSFRSIRMTCPLCSNEGVTGFVIDETKFQPAWSENEITPIWESTIDESDEIDFGTYQVAVCPNCFFASTRLDWFTIVFPEGEIHSSLKPEQVDNLSNAAAQRRILAHEIDETKEVGFFQVPRERKAAYMSWKLNEFNHKHMHADRKKTDGYEIVFRNFMMCKYADDAKALEEHMHSALAWLHSIMQNRAQYSTLRLAKAYTFMISTLLHMGKNKDAHDYFEQFSTAYRTEPECAFWLGRAKYLLTEAPRE